MNHLPLDIVGILKLGEFSQFVISTVGAEFCVADSVPYYIFGLVESLDFHGLENTWVVGIFWGGKGCLGFFLFVYFAAFLELWLPCTVGSHLIVEIF